MDKIEQRALSDLKAAPQNSRKHGAYQIKQIMASIQKFGWTIPVLIDEENMIIAGHARVTAAKRLGMKEGPCIVATGWTAEAKEAYQITDNRLAEQSEWDEEILNNQIKRLNAANFDLGFLDMTAFNTELFNPSVNPNFDTSNVTEAQAQAASDKLTGQFDPANATAPAKADYTVACPHCGEDFEITI